MEVLGGHSNSVWSQPFLCKVPKRYMPITRPYKGTFYYQLMLSLIPKIDSFGPPGGRVLTKTGDQGLESKLSKRSSLPLFLSLVSLYLVNLAVSRDQWWEE